MSHPLPLIIPVENQLRELDAKLLLAVCAANAGLSSYIGYRTEIDINITRFPQSIYLAKSFTHRSDKMFRILSKLGHIICAWDEEALVHYPADIYFTRRLSPETLKHVSHIFAWGQENRELLQSYPELPAQIPIHNVGNPRLDLFRSIFIPYFEESINNIKKEFGEYVLINTNFGNVNAHLPIHNLFINKDSEGNYLERGRGSMGMSTEYAEGRARFKQSIFDNFISLVKYLAVNLENLNIIIRPHPVENKNPYYHLAKNYKNVHVVQKGNVLPWIQASNSIVHNGCTTAIEACLAGKPAIAFEPVSSERYGDALPNNISYQCKTVDEVLDKILASTQGNLPATSHKPLDPFVVTSQDKLCSELIINIIKKIDPEEYSPAFIRRSHGSYLANKRRAVKRIKGLFSHSKYHSSFQNVRFPTQSEDQLSTKIEKLSEILGIQQKIRIRQVSPHIFLVQ